MVLILHIPMCRSISCKSHLERLYQIFVNHKCSIEDDMKINGRYSSHFKENLAKCPVTILHYCQQLWARICDSEEILDLIDNYQERIVCVNFNKTTRTSHGNGATNEMDKFFNDFNTKVLREEKDMREFVINTILVIDTISGAFADSGSTEEPAPAYPPKPHLRNKGIFTQNERYINATSVPRQIFERLAVLHGHVLNATSKPDAAFVMYPDVKEKMYMYVPCAHLRLQGLSDTAPRLDFSKLKSVTDLKELIQQLTTHDDINISFFLNKVVPEFYSSNFAIGLATVATGHNYVLVERSVSMLELLLFRGRLSDSFTTVASLLRIQISLAETIVLISQSHRITSEQKSSSSVREDAMIQRLGHLILLLHLEILPKISKEEIWPEFDDLSFILEKCQQNENMKSVMKILDMMLGKTAIKVTSSMQDMLSISSVDELVEFNRNFWGKDLSQTLAFVFVCLKKLFASMNVDVVSLFEELFVLKSRPLIGQPKINFVVAAIFFNGLSHFVSFCLREAPQKNILEVIFNILKLIYSTEKQHPCLQVTSVHQALLFDPSPDIRRLAIEYLEKNSSYNSCIATFIQKDIQCVMYPYLQITSTADKGKDVIVMLGTFRKTPVKIYALVPSKAQLRGESVTSTDYTRLDRLMKQINIMKDLNHRNIINLFVYRLACLPKFYVLEYHPNNLQDFLVNTNKNFKFCQERWLLSIIVQASSALEYLHNVASVLHCNITAASFDVFGKDRVKLVDFQLAVVDNSSKEIFLDDMSSIPTRWSAPETLRSGLVSKHSDVYMLGSLMYETLTHGVLPHCRLTLDDELYVTQITHHPIKTFREKCFKDEHYQVMTSCLQYYPNKRPCVAEVRSKLQKLLESFPTDEVTNHVFPNMKKEHLRPSTGFEKGIHKTRNYVHTMFAKPQDIVNSTVHVFSLGEFYLAREIVEKRFPEVLINKILRGDLESLAPRIDIYNNESGARGEHIIDIVIPATCSGDVQTLIEKRQLCFSKENCILLLISVVEMLKVIHSEGCIFSQLKPFYLYLDTTGGHMKVYPMSIAQLQFNYGSTEKTATDVKHFGKFMRRIFKKIDSLYHEESPYAYIDDVCTFDEPLTQKPKSCSVNIFQLIQKCLRKERHDRPSIEEIIRELSLELPIKLSYGPSLHSSSLLLSVINPSDSESDDSDSDEDETTDVKLMSTQIDETLVKEVVDRSKTTLVKSGKSKKSKRFKNLFSFLKRRKLKSLSLYTSNIYTEINPCSQTHPQWSATEIKSKYSRPLPLTPVRSEDCLQEQVVLADVTEFEENDNCEVEFVNTETTLQPLSSNLNYEDLDFEYNYQYSDGYENLENSNDNHSFFCC